MFMFNFIIIVQIPKIRKSREAGVGIRKRIRSQNIRFNIPEYVTSPVKRRRERGGVAFLGNRLTRALARKNDVKPMMMMMNDEFFSRSAFKTTILSNLMHIA